MFSPPERDGLFPRSRVLPPMDTLNFADTLDLSLAAIDSNTPIHLVGSPGVGKSALAELVGKRVKKRLITLILSTCDPTDVGGFPIATNGALDRLPLGPILRAAEEGVILFLDELGCASASTQGAALRLILERWAGDVQLHKDTRIIAASNPLSEAANGNDISLPLMGRMTQVHFHPELAEVQNYFYHLGEEGSPLRQLAVDLAATMERETRLLEITPPAGAITSGRQWGAPRNWERGLRLAVAVTERVGDSKRGEKLFGAALASNVGEDTAGAYLAIRKIREKLPTVAQVLKDPRKASVPVDTSTELAALGIIAQVAMTDQWAAWTYAGRLSFEALHSTAHLLMKHPITRDSSPWYKSGYEVRIAVLNRAADAIKDGG